jgi:prepilin-type N-terminal cleavage/methylation domain-containing protein
MKQVRKFNQAAAKLGFTLIELSIVLVIIGLIVGGILVGQDLIKAAEIRSTVSQLEKYSTAVNTFRTKYNGMPGDLLNASNFGFDTRAGTDGLGDGDGLLESSGSTSAEFTGEIGCFWDDMSTAGLINEALNQSTACSTFDTTGAASLYTPVAKLGRGNYIILGSSGGINYLGITGVSSLASNEIDTDDLLTGSEAFQIDTKLDDGAPTTGAVVAVDAAGTNQGGTFWVTPDDADTAGAGECVIAGPVYNFTTSGGADQGCQLRVRASF